jgi:O-antigen ligase/tetratricopeptide (TPR) repeat protein
MPSTPVFFDLTDTADDRFDPIIEVILVALLAFMPLAFGAVEVWSETVVLIAAAAMSIVLTAKLLVRPDVRVVWSWTYVPIACFVALAVFQILPLPPGLVRLVSPATVGLRSDLLAVAPAAERHLSHVTLSFYPEGTREQLRLLVAVCAIYVVAVNVVRRIEQVRRILAAVTVIGTAVALIALVQSWFGATRIYFIKEVYNTTDFFGPFANHSHYGQFMNLSIGAALAMMLIHLGEAPRAHRRAGAASFIPVSGLVRIYALAIALMAVTVFMSGSRGAMVSLAIAGAITLAVMSTQRGLRRDAWLLGGVALAAGIGVLAFRFEQTYQRIASMSDFDTLNGRVQILRDIGTAWRKFPVFGTGLGTFEQVFPPFDRSTIAGLATHAENEYAQLLMETGLAGLIAAAAFLVIVAAAYVRCVRRSPSPIASASVGMGLGLLAILAHSVTDFGQHAPANACLTALFCAMLINLSQAVKHGGSSPPRVLFRGSRGPRIAGTVAVAAMLVVALIDGIGAWRAESIWRSAARMDDYLARRSWRGDDNDFYYLIVPAAEASRRRPANVNYRHLLNFYRWKSISRVRDDEGRLVLSADQIQHARRIADELVAGLWRCPTYGPSYALAGEIRQDILGDPSGAQLVRVARTLAPTNAGAELESAVLEARAGDWDRALAGFRRAIALNAAYRAHAIDVLTGELNRPDLAAELAGEDIDALNRLADRLEKRGTETELAARARRRAEELLAARAADAAAPPDVLISAARLAASKRDLDGAIGLYRRALQAEYARHDWRLELARTLADAARAPEALQEARIVQRSGGDAVPAAQKLVGELSQQLPPPRGFEITTRETLTTSPAMPTAARLTTKPATRPAEEPKLLLPPPR